MTAGRAVSVDTLLLPHHAAILAASTLTPEVIAARGYRSITVKAELRRLGSSYLATRVR